MSQERNKGGKQKDLESRRWEGKAGVVWRENSEEKEVRRDKMEKVRAMFGWLRSGKYGCVYRVGSQER